MDSNNQCTYFWLSYMECDIAAGTCWSGVCSSSLSHDKTGFRSRCCKGVSGRYGSHANCRSCEQNKQYRQYARLHITCGYVFLNACCKSGKMRWLLIAFALVAVGFNMKMLQAFMVVPAFIFYYFIAARVPLKRKFSLSYARSSY